jgi:ABC-2 type transport system permease protein
VSKAWPNIWTVAKKELRGVFGSAVALIFLATFLGVVMFTFFWVEKFFARGVADVRPMFDWLPLLLIFLVAALAMRLWSEERRSGTLEVLLTLPVPRWQLVLGKFLAGMLLVSLALALTLGLPITVSQMGNLDWGPVIGGYLAALLLAAAYLSIGMCVSATTDNQIVALILTCALCGLLYLPGTSAVANLAGLDTANLLRSIGTGSRFSSIARGVLDLRDLAYYLSITGVFLSLNVLLLRARRWSKGSRTFNTRMASVLTVVLVAANALALNLWLAPIGRARVDLTENGEYSLSSTTEHLLGGLQEPLLIRGYFSSKTHPKLAPLVPRILDTLDEYRVAGNGNVRVEVVDPTENDELEKEAKEQYGIESIPLKFSDRHQSSVVSTFFHILVQYGDQHVVLSFDDLIEVKQLDVDDVEIRLRNLEYALTRAIKKVVYGFQSVDALFASMPGKVKLTEYVTPGTLPENWKAAPAMLDKVVAALDKQSGGKLEVDKVEPKGDDEMRQIFRQYGIRPSQSLATGDVYYFDLLLQLGDRQVRVTPPDDVSENSLRDALTEGLKRAAPGFTKVVAMWTPPPTFQPPEEEGGQPQQGPPPQSFQNLQQVLSGTYEVREADLSKGRVADDVDVLLLCGPAGMTETDAQAVDQFLMRGGAVIALDGGYRLNVQGRRLAVEKVTSGLEDLFASWGVHVGEQMVMDPVSDSFPVPIQRDLGGGVIVRDMKELPYPYFVKIDPDRMAEGNLVTAGVPGTTLHWASPITVDPPPAAGSGSDEELARTTDVLLKSSSGAWLSVETDVQPNFDKYEKTGGFPPPPGNDKRGQQVMAVAVHGGFPSWAAKNQKAAGSGSGSGSADLIAHSPPDARLVVIGSSSFVSDDVLELSQQIGSDAGETNLQLVQNAVDWSVSDTDLLAIRARSSAARALTVADDKRTGWEWINYGLAFFGLAVVVVVSWIRRRGVRPIELPAEVKS